MPLTWKVDHDGRLITTTASGALARKDIADYLAAVVGEGAVGYRVIFDARSADLALSPGDLAAFSQTVKDRKRDDVSDGRIALVVSSEAEREMATYFVDRTDSQRPCRLFRTIEDARAWMDDPLPGDSN